MVAIGVVLIDGIGDVILPLLMLDCDEATTNEGTGRLVYRMHNRGV